MTSGTETQGTAAPARTTVQNPKRDLGHTIGQAEVKPKVLMNSDRYMAKAEEAARQLIASWIEYGPKQTNEIPPDSFPGILADVADGVLDAMLGNGARDFPGVFAYFTEAPEAIRNELVECTQGFAPLPGDCGPLLSILRHYAHERKTDMLAGELRNTLERGGDPGRILEKIVEHQAAADTAGQGDVFRVMLAERIFDAATVPPKPVPVVMLDGKCIGTPGNLLAKQAGVKAGKTAVVGAINAAFFIGRVAGDHDTLGFTADNPDGHAVLHLDTEQSRYDHDGTIRRALSRVGMDEPPPWFQSFSIADLAVGNRELAIETAISDAVKDFGGIRCIIIDGVADIMRDPNDAEEAFGLVDKLHAAAIKYDCLIIAVIHENPGSETGKTRGHLGSQLARKAETNLRLHKDTQTGITTIWADYARHCHIPKDQGTCFAWCDLLGRHVSKGKAGEIKASIKTAKFREEAEKAFGDASALSYSALHAAIMEAVSIAGKTAEKRIATYQAEGIVTKSPAGSYSLK